MIEDLDNNIIRNILIMHDAYNQNAQIKLDLLHALT